MEIEARDKLNNNNLHYQDNGEFKANGVVKDVELPLIRRSQDGNTDIEKFGLPEKTNGHGSVETNELVEGHGIQPDHATT